ncbi:MAG TPA: acetate--CoA ligase [Steroidobacteraceae bacterium]|nr:acetate--CoA ligase [Steroidobacteraceae bacterium]
MARKNIDSVLHEMRVFPPPTHFVERASINASQLRHLHERAAQDYVGFWAELAAHDLAWHKPFSVPLDDADAPNYRWFADGKLNVSYNCLDVHLAEHGDKAAIISEGEPGDVRMLSYRELHREVCRCANALKSLGVGHGDRVIIYMPLVPEAVIAMQACARIGAIHSVVFGGFSANAVKDRIEGASARLVITSDGGWRNGHAVELKRAVDKAIEEGCESVESVLVYRRLGNDCPMRAGRDHWWHEVVATQSSECEPEWVEAEHPLFLLYTSGSTGKPKGIQHSSAGYLLGAKVTTRWVFDLKDDDVFWCTADVGWVTGHSYVAYGPLACRATLVMYEGAPTYPDGGRMWKICQEHGVTILYTAPTAIRALMKLGDEIPRRHDLSKLRLLGSVGEPINPEAWMWFHTVIGGGRCPIVDTWWQTETGSIMMSPVPGATRTKPGSCTFPLPGIFADIVDDEGRSVTKADAGGYLVIKRPWPAMLRTIWGDNERYLSTYWEKFQGRFYVAGDSAHRDADGYYWIMGRIDDVLNVAGHRLGTMEIESALVAHPRVAEAAVVGKPHEVKGESVFAYVVLRGQRPQGSAAFALIEELRGWVASQLSPIAKPDDVRITDNLPKTRSGKIMRRLLRSIARGDEITQDVSTLENPAILEQLRGSGHAARDAGAAAPGSGKARAKKAALQKKPPRKAATRKVAAKKVAAKKVAAKTTAPRKTAPRKAASQRTAPKSGPSERSVVRPKAGARKARAQAPARKPLGKTKRGSAAARRRAARSRRRGA